ncbi:uncharacterized protein [Rutidosis leptorrhynchoides]|uniref:uncharacterized protein n=1 Tax=Rutidosis leptorrhynchoides TaxID=125765 RepID=UPI003A995732
MQRDNQLMFTTTTMNLNPEQQPQPQQQHEHLKCPRCESNNTKFCYYNNYNLSQPRHFCKNCRRYWTKGGTLRNIPIGGSTRKKNTKRSSANKTTSNETLSLNVPHEVHVQKHETSHVIQSYATNDEMGLMPGGQFAMLLMDGLNPNYVGGTKEDGLIQNTCNNNNNDDQFGMSGFLGMVHQSSDHESHVSEGDRNGWPDLSIDPPGSSFH